MSQNVTLLLEIDLISFIILAIVLLFNRNHGKGQYKKHCFNIIIVISMIYVFSDAFLWVLDGANFFGARIILQISGFVFYAVGSFITVAWMIYTEIMLQNLSSLRKGMLLYLIPWLIQFVIALFNIEYGILFYFDENNVYQRGELYYIHILIIIIYLVWSLLLIYKNSKNLNYVSRHDALGLAIFPVFPVVGVIIQAFMYGTVFIPVCIALAILVIFLQMNSSLITIDSLTGLNNRRSFERYMEQKLSTKDSTRMYIMLLDLDEFKSINDTYGHLKGDEALKLTAMVLRKSCKNGEFIARFAGDEFIIVGEYIDEKTPQLMLDNLYITLSSENEASGYDFNVDMSAGYSVFETNTESDVDKILDDADKYMYLNKNARKKVKSFTTVR